MTVGKTKRVKPTVAKAIGAMLIIMSIVAATASYIDKDNWLSWLGPLSPVLALIIGFLNLENKPEINDRITTNQ